MEEYPQDIKFKYDWRKYQERVLNELDAHLVDRHLHIIAPPGSGKTVLGLEVAFRINKPTLILAPSIAIRNQWIDRFCELFLHSDIVPDWISSDIREPRFMTVSTYQGVHAACNNASSDEEDIDEEDESEDDEAAPSANSHLEHVVEGLRACNVQTIILDEAHHLKREWWRTLTAVKEQLDVCIVGLTATPPYDVSPNEWERYQSLNGSVDAEISVPELIEEGDLCPHQDYIHFSLPTAEENKSIIRFRETAKKLFGEIKQDKVLIEALQGHPMWVDPMGCQEWIYSHISYYSACLIFLNANGVVIPKTHLDIIADKAVNIPRLDYDWLTILLDFYLYREPDYFAGFEEHRESLQNKLKRYGLLEKKQINFTQNKRLSAALTSSISKLRGIQEIVRFEYGQLGHALRMVILTDYIRKDFYVQSEENNLELNKIGVIPIFEKLRRTQGDVGRMGILSGSMVIIPKSAYTAFQRLADEAGAADVLHSYVPYDENYILLHQTSRIKTSIVRIITRLFEAGEIEILIGTKSLLGEGWDAPCINSLILASFVGSFVLSNQMRGRAIRIQRDNPDKTGNIWHLVTIDPTSPNGGEDIERLRRRFRGFVGISSKENGGIENGLDRLDLPQKLSLEKDIQKANASAFALAADRESLKQRWQEAIANGTTLVEEIKIPFAEEKPYQTVKTIYTKKTIAYFLATLGSWLTSFAAGSFDFLGRTARHIRTRQQLYILLGIIGILGVLFFGRRMIKAARLLLKYRDISKDIRHIGEALLRSLIRANVITTKESDLKIKASVDKYGAVFCRLSGGTSYEENAFVSALYEVIEPIENPRYIIVRKSRFMDFREQKDYHSVPEVLGRNKALAEHFQQEWKRLVGDCDLIYTRTIDGRKMLLKSRLHSLAAEFDDRAVQLNKWR